MKMAQLQEFGISSWFVERWAKTIGPELLDWQADAIRHFDLFGRASRADQSPASGHGRGLIVIAPTSSGKTFLAELAMAEALMRRRKVVYIAPLKALTAQKYEHFREVFAPLGFRVAISTRDRRGADNALRRGNFDIAVTVYEKWQNLLLTHLDILTAVDLVICDEPQLLFDPGRGPTVASIFDVIATVPRAPRVLLLAARLPQTESLAEYLGASIQRVHRRPVELRLGVLDNGRFHFREHNSTEIGDEAFPWDEHLPDAERPMALLHTLAERGEQVLVFCPSKAECHRRAQALAERRTATLELADDDRWRLQSGPSLAAPLAEWLSRQIAVHHADLTPHQRTLVESLFIAGRVSVVFCTGTLAWGVNLPATTVFIDAEKYTSGPHAGRPVPMPLERLEFEGMAGRAGRLGLNHQTVPPTADAIGRGIVWSHTPCEAEVLWQTYIAPPTDHRSDPAASSAPPAFAPEQRLLNWVVAGLAHSPAEAQALAERSPFGRADKSVRSTDELNSVEGLGGRGSRRALSPHANAECSLQILRAQHQGSAGASPSLSASSSPAGSTGVPPVRHGQDAHATTTNSTIWDQAAARLVSAGMLQIAGDGRLVPTPRGSKTAAAGLSAASAAAIVRVLNACGDFDAALWTAFLSALPETSEMRLWHTLRHGTQRRTSESAQITAFWQERFGEGFIESIARRFPSDPAAITVHFPSTAAQTRAMLTALVLDDWAAGVPTRDLEQRFGLPIGRLEPTADMIAWLFETAAALAETVEPARRFAADCHRAGFEIGHGIPASRSRLVEALGHLVPRQTVLDLIDRGWDDPETLSLRCSADLAGLAPPGIIDEMLRRCTEYVAEATAAISDAPSSENNSANYPTRRTRRGKTKHDPKEDVMSPILHLSGSPSHSRMSIELAGRPVTLRLKSFKYLLALATARILTRDGWIAKSDIEGGENQIKYLYQLRRELAQAGSNDVASLIENDGNGHYRLTLPAQAIRLDLNRLLEHSDWDIRSRAERLAAAGFAAAAA